MIKAYKHNNLFAGVSRIIDSAMSKIKL